MHVYGHGPVSAGDLGGQKKVLDALDLEIKAVVSHLISPLYLGREGTVLHFSWSSAVQ